MLTKNARIGNQHALIALVAAVLTYAPYAGAQESQEYDDYTSAMSATDLEYLASEMVFPPIKKDSKLHCEVTVTREGRITNNWCFGNFKQSKKYKKFYKRLTRTLTTADLQPATRNGKPIEVFMQFAFVFPTLNGKDARIVKNDGRLWDQLGPDYEGPQRITQINTYTCPKFTRIKHKCEKEGVSHYLMWDVDVYGRGQNCKILAPGDGDAPGLDHCEREIRFIPGNVNGKIAGMPYVEAFGHVDP